MKNLQVSIEDTMLSYLDKVAELQQKTRTALIREAIAYWIRRKNIEQFENQWIIALKNGKSAYPEEDDAWMVAEAWDDR
jgi:predicted transcriptional regulator